MTKHGLSAVLALAALALPRAAHAEPAPLSGVAVVLVGEDEGRSRDCRDLARETYRRAKLLPRVDEGSAKALCSKAPEPGVDQAAAPPSKIAELRQSLGDRIDNAATRAVLIALANELRTRALVMVSAGKHGTLIRVVRAAEVPAADPLSFDLAAKEDGTPVAWADVAQAIELMLADGPAAAAATASELPGPRKSLAAAIGKDPPEEVPTPLFESPWFWVAAGSVAAVGLAILIVSQTTDVGQGTVTIQGKVLP